MPVALLFVAIAMGIALGTIGAGGSILAVPALVYLGGMSPHDATVVSLLVVGLTALVGGARSALAGTVDWRAVWPIVAGGAAGTALGAAVNQRIDGALLLGLLAVAMLAAAWRMWAGPTREHAHGARRRGIAPLLGVGLLLGIVTGLLGIGGGFLIVPALVLVAFVPMRHAVGTSLVLIAASALLAMAAHLALGARVDGDAWLLGLVVAVIGAVGVLAGGSIGARLPVAALRRGFAGMLVPVAALMIVDAAGQLLG